MIIKFLRPSTSFKGVGYSFAKMLLDKGELMQVKNFHALNGLANVRAADYVHYLEALSSQSKRIVNPQLHVTISTRGKDHSKNELNDIAAKWLDGMGYGQQPYLIVFHKDTSNNHVHIVSTRVGRDGKKIKDSYEWLKGYEVLNRVMGTAVGQQADADLKQALAYQFSTRAQFMMLLEAKGYALALKDNQYEISKYGKIHFVQKVEAVDQRIADYGQNKERVIQIRAIIAKYSKILDPTLHLFDTSHPGGISKPGKIYSSELAAGLHEKLGLQLIFHSKNDMMPYGYTVIDHAQKTVYKGGQIMPMAELTAVAAPHAATLQPIKSDFLFGHELSEEVIFNSQSALVNSSESAPEQLFEHSAEPIAMANNTIPFLRLNIADDVDDEQINGRNRRRKRKARTNSR